MANFCKTRFQGSRIPDKISGLSFKLQNFNRGNQKLTLKGTLFFEQLFCYINCGLGRFYRCLILMLILGMNLETLAL